VVRRILFACLWQGRDLPGYSEDAYGPDYVVHLWRGMRRHVGGGVLVVLCDEYYLRKLRDAVFAMRPGEELTAMMQTLRLELLHDYGIGGWSNVLEVFRGDLWSRYVASRAGTVQRAVVVGLDTVFVGRADWLWDWSKAPIGLPADPYHPEGPCDAVITFNRTGRQFVSGVYDRARLEEPFPYLYMSRPSEMVLLQHLWREQHWPMLEGPKLERLRSYKVSGLAESGIPKHTSVVYFHGAPKPVDLAPLDPVRLEWTSTNIDPAQP
jgi:hypothetical protein